MTQEISEEFLTVSEIYIHLKANSTNYSPLKPLLCYILIATGRGSATSASFKI